MVLIKHEVPSGMEYRYKDHTISERENVFSEAENASAKTQGHDDGEPSKGTSPISFIDHMSAEGRRNYVKRLELEAEQKLSHFNSQPEPDSEDSYQFQLELLEYQNKIKLLKERVRELERKEAAIPPPQIQSPTIKEEDMSNFSTNAHFCNTPIPVRPSGGRGNHALQDYQMQLMLLEQQNKKRREMAQREFAIAGMSTKVPFLPAYNPPLPPPNSYTSQEPHGNSPTHSYYGAPVYENGGLPNYYSPMTQIPPPPPPPQAAAYEAPISGPNGSLFGNSSASPHRADSPHQSIETDWKPYNSFQSHQLPDYNMQLMLLEQQNKKRLMMSRQEEDARFFSPKAATEVPGTLTQEFYLSGPSFSRPPPNTEFNEGRPLALRTAPQPGSMTF